MKSSTRLNQRLVYLDLIFLVKLHDLLVRNGVQGFGIFNRKPGLWKKPRIVKIKPEIMYFQTRFPVKMYCAFGEYNDSET